MKGNVKVKISDEMKRDLNKNFIIQYVKIEQEIPNPLDPNAKMSPGLQKIGVVIADQNDRIGWSLCDPRDHFSGNIEDEGFQKALERMELCQDWQKILENKFSRREAALIERQWGENQKDGGPVTRKYGPNIEESIKKDPSFLVKREFTQMYPLYETILAVKKRCERRRERRGE